ncbi:MAG: thiamine pyrophosphokinase, partial [Gammaproteobacteria bacterium]|nr:thiamine pyrophosphokinase [Gammaproteobacteria bacterium]
MGFDCIIAADGGANKCYDIDIVPDYIIGDFDSISSEALDFFEDKNTHIIHAPSQSTLDFQEAIWLAETIFSGENFQHGLDTRRSIFLESSVTSKNLNQSAKNKPMQITIFAGLSDSEIDHTLGNLLLGVSLPDYITLKFFQPDSEIYISKKSLTLEGEKNDIVSVIPLQKTTGLNYINLLYPVNNQDVDTGWLGCRNRMTGRQATINFTS